MEKKIFEKEFRYREYELAVNEKGSVFNKDGSIFRKWPSDRGHVMITERVAEFNNSHADRQKLWYELDEENPANKDAEDQVEAKAKKITKTPKDEPKREKTPTQLRADELGVKYMWNISDEKLQIKIDKHLENQKIKED